MRAAQQRAIYRIRQFRRALLASLSPLSDGERAQVRAVLDADAWLLFSAMPRADQRHSLNVLHALEQIDLLEPGSRRALLQAALLHDCAKHAGGVQLWHRVAAVLLKAGWPGILERWGAGPVPARGNWRYPFWAYVNHPSLGAGLAAQAGCSSLAVWLISHHQGPFDPAGEPASHNRRLALLAVLQAADDDN